MRCSIETVREGDMKVARRCSLTTLIAFILILAAPTYVLAREGFQHVEPASELRLAVHDWQMGHLAKSAGGVLRAFGIAIEAGARWSVARIYINRMNSERASGQLDEALSLCGKAIKILHGYDDEGAISNECFVIEAAIHRQDTNTLSP
jgi:hypothetical protein